MPAPKLPALVSVRVGGSAGKGGIWHPVDRRRLVQSSRLWGCEDWR